MSFLDWHCIMQSLQLNLLLIGRLPCFIACCPAQVDACLMCGVMVSWAVMRMGVLVARTLTLGVVAAAIERKLKEAEGRLDVQQKQLQQNSVAWLAELKQQLEAHRHAHCRPLIWVPFVPMQCRNCRDNIECICP
jgi:hypothetical protein